MSFIDKATTFITGKNSTEREADRATAKIIREKQNAIIRQERVKQAEILARERVRAQTESQIKKIKQSYQPRQQSFSQFDSVFGAPVYNLPKKTKKRLKPAGRVSIWGSSSGKQTDYNPFR